MTAVSEPLVVAQPSLRPARLSIFGHPKIVAGAAILGFFLLLTVAHPILNATLWEGRSSI